MAGLIYPINEEKLAVVMAMIVNEQIVIFNIQRIVQVQAVLLAFAVAEQAIRKLSVKQKHIKMEKH